MRYIFMTVALFAFTACMSMGTKVDQDKLTQFEKGKTTYAEVIQQLGKPTQSIVNSDGTRTVVYTYVQSQAKAANFIPIVGAVAWMFPIAKVQSIDWTEVHYEKSKTYCD